MSPEEIYETRKINSCKMTLEGDAKGSECNRMKTT